MTSKIRLAALAACVTSTLVLGACASPDPWNYGEAANSQPAYPYGPSGGSYAYGTAPAPGYAQPGMVESGRITNIALVSNGMGANGAPSNGNVGAGTIAGAIVGGVLGNQIGHGGGRAAATILGTVGGAAVGNRLAQNQQQQQYANNNGPVYRVWVQTDSGVSRTYDVSSVGDLRPGDRVRIENGVIYHG